MCVYRVSLLHMLQMCALHHVKMEVHALKMVVSAQEVILEGLAMVATRKTLTLLVHRVITILCSAALCFPECINGQCTIPIPGQPGVCVCDSGWTGEGCNESKTLM